MAIITKGKAQQTLVASVPTGFSFSDASVLRAETLVGLNLNGKLVLPKNSQVNVLAFPGGLSGGPPAIPATSGVLGAGSATIITAAQWSLGAAGSPSNGFLITTGAA